MHTCRSVVGAILLALAVTVHAEDQPTTPPATITSIKGLTEVEGKDLRYWTKQLKSHDASMRERAISVLPLFGQTAVTSDILGLLLERCHDQDISPKLRAVQVLNSMRIQTIYAERVVKEFTHLVDDIHTPIRFAAAVGLTQLGYEAKSAIPVLAKHSEDKYSWEVRRACLMALIATGHSTTGAPDPVAVEALIKAASDKTVEVRLESAIGLGAIGKTNDSEFGRKVGEVLKTLQKDSDTRVVIWARCSELALGDAAEEDISGLTAHLSSPKVAVRSNALRALGSLRTRARPAQAKVIEALDDKDPTVQAAAVPTLVAMLGEPKAEDIQSLTAHLGSPKATVRANILRGLTLLGPKALPAQPKVFEALRDKDQTVQLAAIGALVAMEDRGPVVLKEVKELINGRDSSEMVRIASQLAEDVLLKRTQPTIKTLPPATTTTPAEKEHPHIAANAVTEWEGKSLGAWLDEVKNEDASIREHAISVLPLFGPAIKDSKVIGILLNAAIHYDDASPRLRALQVLNSLPFRPSEKNDIKRVVAGLTARLRDDPQALVRYEAALGLVRFGEDASPAIGVLERFSADPTSWEIRRVCLMALAGAARNAAPPPKNASGPDKDAWAPDKRAVRAMINRASDGTAEVRLEAAVGLGALGRSRDEVLKPLIEHALNNLIRDRDPRVIIWGMVSQMALGGYDDNYARRIVNLIRPANELPIRLHAIRAMGAMGDKGKIGLDRIIDALNDKEPVVQLAAMGALVAIKDRDKSVLDALTDLAQRDSAPEGIRLAAKAAHDQLQRGSGLKGK